MDQENLKAALDKIEAVLKEHKVVLKAVPSKDGLDALNKLLSMAVVIQDIPKEEVTKVENVEVLPPQ